MREAYVMDDFIKSLRSEDLIAECPICDGEFKLSDALLFDGTKPFPEEAEVRRAEYEEDLEDNRKNLEKRIKLASERAAVTAEAVSIGKMVEHLTPILDGFGFEPTDCRPLFEPIDFLVFEGLSAAKVNRVSFVEVKTGNARLNPPQRLIRDAIKDNRVFFEEA
jgi:predicted Holliday junction resolvase-like endonuclease